ncbi:MAG: YbaN family protein [Rikenellaceae bacterium]
MKIIFIIIGCISLALGTIGIFVPLLPTTPFLLLSAALFLRSSPRLHQWLITRPMLGRYISNYQNKRAMPLRAKIFSITLMWASILFCIFFIVDHLWWLQILLAIKSTCVTIYILRLGTIKEEE